MEMLESLGNLAGAEFLPVRAFLGFFCKISTPEVKNLSSDQERLKFAFWTSVRVQKC